MLPAAMLMIGGTVENGSLENTMRGLCIGSYSESNGDRGHAVARIFGGDVVFTGSNSNDRAYTIYGNKTDKLGMFIFDAEKYEGMYKRATAGACPDETHNTVTGEVAATCLTHGATEHTCNTCGVWYEITADPTGHSEVFASGDHGTTKHTCTACDALWYTEETPEA